MLHKLTRGTTSRNMSNSDPKDFNILLISYCARNSLYLLYNNYNTVYSSLKIMILNSQYDISITILYQS